MGRSAIPVLVGAVALTACALFTDFGVADPAPLPDSGASVDAGVEGAAAGTCGGDLQGDARNCGACGRVCEGTCTKGRCQAIVVANGQSGLTGFAAGGGAVAWTRDHRLFMVNGLATPADPPLASGATTPTFSGPIVFAGPNFLVATDNEIYPAAPLDVDPVRGDAIGFVGDPITALAGHGNAIAVEWNLGAEVRAAICETCSGYIGNWAQQIGAIERTGLGAMQLAPAGLFFTQQKAGVIRRCPRASGAACQTLAAGQVTPGPLAVDPDGVTWSNATSGQLLRCPIAGCGPAPTVFADRGAGAAIVSIVAAGDYVYWTESGPGNVARCARTGAGVELLAQGLQGPTRLAVDRDVLFVAEEGAGRIYVFHVDP